MRALGLFVVLLVAAPADADEVEGPPDDCPPGSEPHASHAGPTCRPLPDCTDGSCAAGERCVEMHQCVDRRGCGGRRDDPTCFVSHVMDECGPTTSCGGAAECLARRVCRPEAAVAAPPATPPPATSPSPASSATPETGTGCGIAPGPDRAFSGVAALAVALTAIAGVLYERRRR